MLGEKLVGEREYENNRFWSLSETEETVTKKLSIKTMKLLEIKIQNWKQMNI